MAKKKETRGRKQIRPLLMVKKMYPFHSDKEIAEMLDVPVKYVRNIGGRYKLKKKSRAWTKKEDKILLQYYPQGTKAVIEALAIAKHEPRTRWAIINRKRELTK